ncbi:FAM10A4 [Vespula maculifrons]|uniref:FAM10A4 n=1 Tax=Vespula maculifrons TaxID=7453 RepID=A0ABD2CEX3_VESMC
MSVPNLSLEHLAEVKAFVELCKLDPSILCKPEFAFVKSLIEHFGGKVEVAKSKSETECKIEETETKSEIESEESDLELDMTGVIEPETDAPQEMGNFTLQPTEEEITESQAKRSEAVSAFVEKDYEKAIQLYTEAIILNPQAALLYAKRGQIYLLLNKPNACIRDCDRALELNPDSAAGHKFRGRAYHLLGKWEEAANDLRLACKFDFDEQADEWLREATPNNCYFQNIISCQNNSNCHIVLILLVSAVVTANSSCNSSGISSSSIVGCVPEVISQARKIEEHKRKKERKLEEGLGHAKGENVRKEKEEEPTKGTGEKGDFYKFLSDPEMLEGFMDPEISVAFKEIYENPTSLWKYHKNPKIVTFIEKVAKKFDDGTGRPNLSGMMAGMPGCSGINVPQFTAPKPSQQPQDDVDRHSMRTRTASMKESRNRECFLPCCITLFSRYFHVIFAQLHMMERVKQKMSILASDNR